MYIKGNIVNVETDDRPSTLALKLEARMIKIEREREFLFEKIIFGLNTQLNNYLSFLEVGKVFLIEEDGGRWLLFADRDEQKKVSEFINKVFIREAQFNIGRYPFKELFKKWYVYFHPDNFSELEIVTLSLYKTGMEITEITQKYFEEMGFKVKVKINENE